MQMVCVAQYNELSHICTSRVKPKKEEFALVQHSEIKDNRHNVKSVTSYTQETLPIY